jgi:uncharacterized protein (TIGR00251 family)
MKIWVQVRSSAPKNEVRKLGNDHYLVRVTAPAVEGKANEKLLEVLAKYFQKPKRNLLILVGEKSTRKIVEIR